MRKLVAWEMVSLDGIMEAPERWAFSYSDDEMSKANASGMAASDALLLGRETYEHLAAYWPHQPSSNPVAEHINSVPKFVVSQTLKEPLAWTNATLVEGSVAEEIINLKRQAGKNITVLGSGILVQSLLRDGLLDELGLMVHPIVVGGGKRLFENESDQKALELIDSKVFGTGFILSAHF